MTKRVVPAAAVAVAAFVLAACQSTEVRGPAGESVVATTPSSVTLRRGAMTALEVAIDRERFQGAVTVSISQLPKGVSADRPSATVESTMATFVLTAARDADLVTNQKVAVTVEGMGGRKAMQYVSLDVLD